MRLSRLLPAALLLLTTAATCPTEPAGDAELREARRRWTSQGLVHYRYDYQRSCFCIREATRPVTIEVRAGAVVSVIDRETGASLPLEAFGRRWPTVADLLDEVERAVEEADRLEVTYDPTTGHPASVSIDWLRNAADDETAFTAGDVRRVE